jgi:hypothetical protein
MEGLIKNLERCFPTHDLVNETGIIYPHYWEAPNVEVTFLGHLTILKTKSWNTKAIFASGANGTLLVSLLDLALLN